MRLRKGTLQQNYVKLVGGWTNPCEKNKLTGTPLKVLVNLMVGSNPSHSWWAEKIQPTTLVSPKRLDACQPTWSQASTSLTQTKTEENIRKKHQLFKQFGSHQTGHTIFAILIHKKILSTRTPGFMYSSQAKVEWLAISLWLVNLPPYRPETRPYLGLINHCFPSIRSFFVHPSFQGMYVWFRAGG